MVSKRFAIAVSFPGEHRRFVRNVVDRLAEELGRDRIFFDEWYESELVGQDGDLKLRQIYRDESEFVVPFFSEHYKKPWCKIEWSATRAMLLELHEEDCVLPVQMDLSSIPGWEAIDFAISRKRGARLRTGREIAEVLLKAYRQRTKSLAPAASPEASTHTGTSQQDNQQSNETRASTPPAIDEIEISRIAKYAPPELIGREDEMALLNEAWDKVQSQQSGRPHVLTFVALGGEGKTSLVSKWVAELAALDWPGCESVFAWSFYSQGTREQTAVSSDLFLAEALRFFGDPEMAGSAQGAFEKGRRLAQLVGKRQSLLILDGLEPLQYAPGPPLDGQLKDQGISELLRGLATTSHGLCVVTTRFSVPDLKNFWQTTAREVKLLRLSQEAGVALLKSLDVKGTQDEYEKLVSDVKGHALTLNLLGSYLRDFHAGDIRHRDLIRLEEADAEEQSGHAFRVMDAYVKSFETGCKTKQQKQRGRQALSILQLLGLFDRPATADCLEALWTGEAIPGLTDSLVRLSETERNGALTRLESARLLTANRDGSRQLVSLDTHPLIREYFAQQLRGSNPNETSEVWRAAHRRLYEHLCETTNEGDQPTLEDLQPLYQAVAHGCHAGLVQEAHDDVHLRRIRRGDSDYADRKLGAFGSELGAEACFFDRPWSQPSSKLREKDQASLLNNSAYELRALGRLTEALEPMRAALEMSVTQETWRTAAISASNLSELELTLGEVSGAVSDAERSVTYANRSGDAGQRMLRRTTHADALHQSGRRSEAESLFREAEQMQAERQPPYPLLYSLRGFQYCDLLLAPAEREAWRVLCEPLGVSPRASFDEHTAGPAADASRLTSRSETLKACRAVTDRATQTLKWGEQGGQGSLLTIALDHLTLSRAALYESLLSGAETSDSESHISNLSTEIEAAVSGLRRAGTTHHLPRGLLTRAWQRSLLGQQTGSDSAQSDLDEAWEIASRGPMPLFMADIHLHRARLFGEPRGVSGRVEEGTASEGIRGLTASASQYPWESVGHDLTEARRLIEKHGYGRRTEELEDAEEALLRKRE